ncbi:hypothetical protein AB205_0065200 [Aquarana catesbeiana]|uniref:Uncharacterized protein n=1 Tax=Aquarana catesbeiana TaxID=8400 RepID=A0A2G9SN96_AQUCT|nr:hypothetical protein AB205_0065200 [Aquarana catesbeiana]
MMHLIGFCGAYLNSLCTMEYRYTECACCMPVPDFLSFIANYLFDFCL